MRKKSILNPNSHRPGYTLLAILLLILILFILRYFFLPVSEQGSETNAPSASAPGSETNVSSASVQGSETNTPSASVPGNETNTSSALEQTTSNSDESTYNETTTESEVTIKSNPDRITYKGGFYYEPLSEEIKQKITGISYQENTAVTYDMLRYVKVQYLDFNGQTQMGELICNKQIAQDLVEIFAQLYENAYPIEKIMLIDEYGGDDDLSCADNNTSCFNYRVVAGTEHLSKHALGLAIDINPFYNPYITYPGNIERISPEGSEKYADRESGEPYMILKNDLCYNLFIEHGFQWGGNWKSLKDYQHFQKDVE